MKKKPNVYERRSMAARELSKLKTSGSDLLTESEAKKVLEILKEHQITSEDFFVMDARPGMFFSDNWHWKLRQFRDRHGTLLRDLFTANAAVSPKEF